MTDGYGRAEGELVRGEEKHVRTEEKHVRAGDELVIEGLRLLANVSDRSETTPSLRLRRGDITVLVGANGSGKTRLLETIAGLRDPEALVVRYGDESLWVRKRGLLRRKRKLNHKALQSYAYSCQAPEEQLFMRSMREELAYSLRPYALDDAEQAACSANGLAAADWGDEWLERDPYAMSGGERRRTALACLFAPPAGWLFLDEPTAGLDASGHELLAAELRRRASAGQGILMISHETDWAFAVADRILILQADGQLRDCAPEALLAHPHWLTEAGMEIPDWFSIAHVCAEAGIATKDLWDPARLARALLMPTASISTAAGGAVAANASAVISAAAITAEVKTSHAALGPQTQPAGRTIAMRASERAPARSPIANFDPRAAWLTYVMVSTAMLQLRSWAWIGAAALLVAAAIHFGRIPLRRWRVVIRAIATFTVALALFAGLGRHGASFWSLEASLASLRSLIGPLLVMLLGFGLPIAVTPLRLRRSLEQAAARFGRIPHGLTKALLTITLLLRFVPVLLSEWERFGRISAARGKRPAFSWRGGLRAVQETAIPFMLSLFRLGEQVADALESRGVGTRKHPTVLATETWRSRDSFLVAAGFALCSLLLFVE